MFWTCFASSAVHRLSQAAGSIVTTFDSCERHCTEFCELPMQFAMPGLVSRPTVGVTTRPCMVGASGGSDGDMSWESSGRLECRSTCEEWHGKAWQTRRRCVRDSQRPATTGAYPSGRVSPLSRQQDRLYIGFLLFLSRFCCSPAPHISLSHHHHA